MEKKFTGFSKPKDSFNAKMKQYNKKKQQQEFDEPSFPLEQTYASSNNNGPSLFMTKSELIECNGGRGDPNQALFGGDFAFNLPVVEHSGSVISSESIIGAP